MTKETFVKRHPGWTVALTLLGVLLVAGLFSTGSDKKSSSSSTSTSVAAGQKANEPAATLNVTRPASSTYHTKVTVSGTVAGDGARVMINGRLAEDATTGAFSDSVPLPRVGDNKVVVLAQFNNGAEKQTTVTVTRKQSAAQRAAIRARAAAQRARAQRAAAAARLRAQQAAARVEARRAAYVANYKASAKSIPYKQLDKNADAYAGQRVKFYGQIFQIQEDSGGGLMLLSVTDEGFDLWTDNVWVNYDHPIKSAEDDMVTVYGTVVGTKSYETQIGGETYVPEIDAKYIDE